MGVGAAEPERVDTNDPVTSTLPAMVTPPATVNDDVPVEVMAMELKLNCEPV